MSKVYVIQATRHQADVTPARVYGEIEFVLSPSDRMSSSPDLHIRKLIKGLDKFDADHDFILWSGGDPLSCMLTGWVLAEMDIRTFRYLRYEKGEGRKDSSAPFYVPVLVTPFTD